VVRPYREAVASRSFAGAVRANIRALREPRYASLAALMLLVAIVCVGAGTWQIARFDGKVHDNDAMRANAHSASEPIGKVLPLVGAPAPSADAVRYRNVTATGRFDDAHTALVRLRNASGKDGSLVLTPFVTGGGELLVVRGLYADGRRTPVPAAPPGQFTVSGRVQTSESNRDSAADVARGRVLSINAAAQAAHLHKPVYDGYAELLPGQPGTKNLIDIPGPDLSNPAGGAVEPQHFAYIIQWYLFALLALAAPFAMMRADRRERAASGDESSAQPGQPAAPQTDEQRRSAKLADRYGRTVPR
jgi:cytochrome oxidase assembly protein ShyY1